MDDLTNNLDLYDDMNLYITSESFIVEPNGKDDLLIIGRLDKTTCVQVKNTQLLNHMPTRRICGILGTLHLQNCDYLVIATHRLFVGAIKNVRIWRLAGYDIIPYVPNSHHQPANDQYLKLLRQTLDTCFFYFSYGYDITHSLQRQRRMSSTPQSKDHIYERADKRFVWNGALLDNFKCAQMSRFQLPLMLGFVSINQASVDGQTFFFSVISRRSVERAGTRLFCRGINELGHCANFVETEQIVEFNGHEVSFVQTRGSMPFFWDQLPNLRFKTRPQIIPGMDHLAAFTKHFEDQIAIYGYQIIINLVDQQGAEGKLEATYRKLFSELNSVNVGYQYFDFHKNCKNLQWYKINELIERLVYDLEEFNVFHASDKGGLISVQSGVFRTNCIDCLDRTNVLQSMLATQSLQRVLSKLGILKFGETIASASMETALLIKNVWADNGDLISLQYSGTRAMKTDFTRTGKRTKLGMMQDGMTSLKRYYLNNFADGKRQDGIDLFLGIYTVDDGEGQVTPSPLKQDRTWRYNTLPSVLVFAVTMFFMSIAFPYNFNTENLIFMLFWGAIIAASATGILRYGDEFVQWPRFFPPIEIQA